MTERSRIRGAINAAVGIAVVIVGSFVAQLAVSWIKHQRSDPRSAKTLNRLASQLNKNLPMAVDKETELMNVVGLKSTLVYNYRLVNYSASEIDREAVIAHLKPSLVTAACSAPQTRDAFLKEGIVLRYTYFSKDRTYIATIDVAPADCGY